MSNMYIEKELLFLLTKLQIHCKKKNKSRRKIGKTNSCKGRCKWYKLITNMWGKKGVLGMLTIREIKIIE